MNTTTQSGQGYAKHSYIAYTTKNGEKQFLSKFKARGIDNARAIAIQSFGKSVQVCRANMFNN